MYVVTIKCKAERKCRIQAIACRTLCNLPIQGSYDQLQAVYDTIYGKYLPEMECTLSDEPSAERYLNDPSCTPPEELLTEIYIPIR